MITPQKTPFRSFFLAFTSIITIVFLCALIEGAGCDAFSGFSDEINHALQTLYQTSNSNNIQYPDPNLTHSKIDSLAVFVHEIIRYDLNRRNHRHISEFIDNLRVSRGELSSFLDLADIWAKAESGYISKLPPIAQLKNQLNHHSPGTRSWSMISIVLCHIYRYDGRLNSAEAMAGQVINSGASPELRLDAMMLYASIEILREHPGNAIAWLQAGLNLCKKYFPYRNHDIQTRLKHLNSIHVTQFNDYRHTRVLKIQDHFNIHDCKELYFDNSGLMNILTKEGRCFFFDPNEENITIEITPTGSVRHLNRSENEHPLFVLESALITHSKQIRMTEMNANLDIIDAVWSAPGNYWIIDDRTDALYRYDSESQKLVKIKPLNVSFRDRLFSDALHRLWWISHAKKEIIQINVNGEKVVKIPFAARGYALGKPDTIVFDEMNSLMVLNSSNSTIAFFSSNGKYLHQLKLEQIDPGFKGTSLMVPGNNGEYYLADPKTNCIYKTE